MCFRLRQVYLCRGFSCLAKSHIFPTSISSRIKTLVQQGEYRQALHLYTKHGSSPLRTSIFTFPSLLKACASLPNLDYGKTIHASVIVLGRQYDLYIASSLVNMYVKGGLLDYAVQVFDVLSENGVSSQDVTVWNSMIDGYFRFGHFKAGVDQLRRMLELGVRPDAYSLTIVVGVLCKDGNRGREGGKQIHGYMLRNSWNGDSFLETALIDMYFKFGLSTNAWRLFVGMKDKANIVIWNVMIVGFLDNGLWESSLELYTLAKSNSVKPVSTSITGALGACGQSENVDFGKQIHGDVVKMGLEHDPFVCTSLLTMYGKCSLVDEAGTIFHNIPDKGLEIWNAIIAAYANNDCGHNALELFDSMRQKNVMPDSFTLSNIITCCSMLGLYEYGKSIHAELVKRPIQSKATVESALLTMYSKSGRDNDASLVFNSMEVKDLVAWGALISGFCRNGKFTEALEIFRCMKNSESLRPDSDIMASVINACTGLEALGFGLQVHGYMMKTGLELDVFVGSSLIDLYSKCDVPEMAFEVFSGMPRKNIVAWNSMISCYSRNNLPELSIGLFHEMVDHGFFPDSVSITSVLVAISLTARLLKGKSLHGHTIRLNIPFDTHLENALIDMYMKCGFLEYAQNIFRRMLHKTLVSWNLMISGYGSHGNYLGALALFDEMKRAGEEPDDLTFLSLISACNHSGFVQEGKTRVSVNGSSTNVDPHRFVVYLRRKLQEIKITRQKFFPRKKEDGWEFLANMVDLLGRAGHLEEAYSFVRAMPVEADKSIWLCLLSASRTHHNVELGILSAENLLRIEPDRGSNYVQMINLYMEAGLREKAAETMALMKEKGLQKKPGCSWIEVRNRTRVFFSGSSYSSSMEAEVFNALNSLKCNMKKENNEDSDKMTFREVIL
ncbi:PREDICTED: pentatricopeptide repeat-containing protein At2g40720 [Tarenaya hassleriana]|uniref:pentatricopeptide repeat-containing protein At2g40720 n=1 Tax=Tarenaya hassleriana TaxID=28532 RepID=UPI00053C2FB0|nr:PREDICTED: pentatricopeptide repeat-containing protein At2g40720 [Tarenaya hassleriana]